MYDGTRYVGWQIQPKGISIQGLIKDALKKMTGEDVKVIGASRTDAGVHALSQVAHFVTQSKIKTQSFKGGLNSILPPDIAVISAEDVRNGFHARRDAKGKRYLYRILVSEARDPFLINRSWRIERLPDIDAMRHASHFLIGEHDFSSFCASGSTSRHAVRRIDRADVVMGEEGNIFDIKFAGNGFLRHMIRNIVGTLVDVGLKKIETSAMKRIIAGRDRKKAGRCAPACGLYLVDVIY